MSKFRARVQYPYTTWHEQEVEVEAATEEEARMLAVRVADEGGWDKAAQVGDGECGESEIASIKEVAS